MKIEIKEVTSRGDLCSFIYLPKKIHSKHKNWVPPIYSDEWEYFDPLKNKAFKYCDYKLLLALRDNEVVGRCMGLIHKHYNEKHHEKNARFSFIECYNDEAVFHALIHDIEKWAREKGMTRLVGPFAFSDKDPQGFLIEGFDEPVSIATNCNFEYMVELAKLEGFIKKVDLVAYKIIIPDKLPEIYLKIEERFKRNNNSIQILGFNARRKVKPYIRAVLGLINKTFVNIYGFTPFDRKEMDDFANRYLYLINPRFIKVAVNEKKEVIGTIIGMSDISKGIQKSKGRLFPFGFISILSAGKKSRQLNLLLGAVDPRYQGSGIDVMMGIKMIESAKAEGKTVIDSHLELEHNTKVRAEMERMGGQVYKRFRIFEKELGE